MFLANTGGLLGLFMGFSVLSLIEIFYFITMRPYYKYLRNGNRKKASAGVVEKPVISYNQRKLWRRHQFVKPYARQRIVKDRIFYPAHLY